MPHIHAQPNQHDITVSAYIILLGDSELKMLVHMHRKYNKLLQIGGHIELDETPWQAIAHELREESGFSVDELSVLQPMPNLNNLDEAIVHPTPLLVNTHKVGSDHYHSDLCYAFVAEALPSSMPLDGESEDLRWLTKDELTKLASEGLAMNDCTQIYLHILDNIGSLYRVKTSEFSLEKPGTESLKYVA